MLCHPAFALPLLLLLLLLQCCCCCSPLVHHITSTIAGTPDYKYLSCCCCSPLIHHVCWVRPAAS
jgi:hypothetical protein